MLASDPSLERTFSGHRQSATSLSWAPNSTQLASGGADGSVVVWNLRAQQRAFKYVGHADAVLSVDFSPDGSLLASASKDGSLRLWRPTVCVVCCCGCFCWFPAMPSLSGPSRPLTFPFSPRATPSRNHSQGKSETYKPHTSSVQCVAFSPDGRSLVTGGNDKTLKIFSVSGGLSLRFERSLSGHANWVRAAAWSPDSSSLFSGAEDSTARVWDAATGVCTGVLYDFASPVTCAAWSPDGRTLAAGSAEGAIKLWDARAPARILIQHYAAHTGGVASVAWHPSGGALLSTGAQDGTAKICDVAEGHVLYTVRGHRSAGVPAGAFAPGGDIFATAGGDGAVLIWRANFEAMAGTSAARGESADAEINATLRAIAGGSAVVAAQATNVASAAAAVPSSPSASPRLAQPHGGSPRPATVPTEKPLKSSPTATGRSVQNSHPAPINSTAILEAEPSLGMAMHYIASQLERIHDSIATLGDRVSATERGIAELRGADALNDARASGVRSRVPNILREPVSGL